jgi:hypothetical protein
MNLLDENVPENQTEVLDRQGVHARQIGRGVGRLGMQDPEILTLLHSLRRVTFFSLDWDFSGPYLSHPAYCLVFLHVQRQEAAMYIRRVLRHPELNTQAKRMGAVVRASEPGLRVWRRNAAEELLAWPRARR